MKTLIALFAVVMALPAMADTTPKASLKVVTVKVHEIGTKATELKVVAGEEHNLATIGVPVKIAMADGCTTPVGQRHYWVRISKHYVARAINLEGTVDPLADKCQLAAPEPTDALVTVDFQTKLKEDGTVTYSQNVLIGRTWVKVSYTPSTKMAEVSKF